jgi:hypothetical protein
VDMTGIKIVLIVGSIFLIDPVLSSVMVVAHNANGGTHSRIPWANCPWMAGRE